MKENRSQENQQKEVSYKLGWNLKKAFYFQGGSPYILQENQLDKLEICRASQMVIVPSFHLFDHQMFPKYFAIYLDLHISMKISMKN